MVLIGRAITHQESLKLQNAKTIICADKSLLPKGVGGSVHEIDQVRLHQIACELRDTWNEELLRVARELPGVLFTMGGTSRSENSDIIRCLCLFTYVERKFPGCHIAFIGAGNTQKLLAYIGNAGRVKHCLTLFSYLQKSFLKTSWHLFRSFLIWCFCRDVISEGALSTVAFSLAKHFGDEGDSYYGAYFDGTLTVDRVILAGSLGGLQPGSARSQVQICRRFRNFENLSVLTDGASPMRLFSLAWASLRFMASVVFWRNKKPKICRGSNDHIKRLLRLELINSLHHYVSHAQLNYKLVSRSIMEDRKKILTYHFEFPMGRVIAGAAHENSSTKVFGLQHGLISHGKWCYHLVGNF